MTDAILWWTDIALAEIEKEKRLSNVKAWEESEKSKAENKWAFILISFLHFTITSIKVKPRNIAKRKEKLRTYQYVIGGIFLQI